MRRWIVAVVFGVLLAAVPVAGSADVGELAVGDPISLFSGPFSYPADTAFHVRHGHRHDPDAAGAIGNYTFELAVDGVSLDLSTIRVVEAFEPPDGPFPQSEGEFLSYTYVYNFPEGLPQGWHLFEGTWTSADGSVFYFPRWVEFTP